MENQSMKVSKVFFIKDFCILVICNLLFWDDYINRLLLYPIYVVFLGIGLYCMYYLYKVDNGYKKLNIVEEAQHSEWREKFKGDKEMEEFLAPEEKVEGEDTFKKKGLKDFCSYMLLPCAITLFGDVLDIIIGFIN